MRSTKEANFNPLHEHPTGKASVPSKTTTPSDDHINSVAHEGNLTENFPGDTADTKHRGALKSNLPNAINGRRHAGTIAHVMIAKNKNLLPRAKNEKPRSIARRSANVTDDGAPITKKAIRKSRGVSPDVIRECNRLHRGNFHYSGNDDRAAASPGKGQPKP